MSNKTPLIRDNTPVEEADIIAQIREDDDLSEIPMNTKVLKRGRPVGQSKEQVTVRLDKELLKALKTPDAKGWQTRLNQAARSALGLD